MVSLGQAWHRREDQVIGHCLIDCLAIVSRSPGAAVSRPRSEVELVSDRVPNAGYGGSSRGQGNSFPAISIKGSAGSGVVSTAAGRA